MKCLFGSVRAVKRVIFYKNDPELEAWMFRWRWGGSGTISLLV